MLRDGKLKVLLKFRRGMKKVGFAGSKMEKRTVMNMERIVIQFLKLLFLKLFSTDPSRKPTTRLRMNVGSDSAYIASRLNISGAF